MSQDYLESIFGKLDKYVTEENIIDMSLDLSEDQLDIVHDYILSVYKKSEKNLRLTSKPITTESISITESNKMFTFQYVEGIYLNAEGKDRNSSMMKMSSCEEDDITPPSINVIEDKNMFNVSKYMNGIKQEGYSNDLFNQTISSSKLKEKVNTIYMNKVNDDGNKTEGEIKPKQKKVEENEDDYIQRLMKGSFSKEKKAEQIENKKIEFVKTEDKPQKRKLRLNKQETIIKNTPVKVVQKVNKGQPKKNIKII